LVVRTWLQSHPFTTIDGYFVSNQALCRSDRVDALKLENHTLLVKPVSLQVQFESRLPLLLQSDLGEVMKPFRKISQDVSSNLPPVPLSLDDAGHRDARRFLQSRLLQNLKRKSLSKLHSGCTQDSADRTSCSALFADDLAEVIGSNSEFQDGGLLAFDRLHGYL